ncbi:MAG: hypothetical protein AAF658_09985, partial [Myxococcota bacterium]
MEQVRRYAVPFTLILAGVGVGGSACGGEDENAPANANLPVAGSPTAVAIANPPALPELGTLTLDGSASSDSAGETLSFLWEQVSGPTSAINDSAAAVTTVTVPSVNENRSTTFRLTVTNSSGVTNSDLVFVTIVDGGVAPNAVAGIDQTVDATQTVTLDGSASSDDGNLVNFLWERLSGPNVSFANQASQSTTFVAPDVTAPSTLLMQLTVTDNDGITDSSTLQVVVNPVPTSVAFVSAPVDALRNTPLAPLAVEVQNGSGSRIVDGRGAETQITVNVTTGSGALDGPTVFDTVDGVAVLSATSYPEVEMGVELTATATDLTAGTVMFNVTWPAAFPAALP